MPPKMTALCPSCMKFHAIDYATFNLFGFDCSCLKCVEWAHKEYEAKRLRSQEANEANAEYRKAQQ